MSATRRPHEVTIDAVPYLVAELGQYSRSTIAPQRAQVDQGTQSGEGSMANAGLWRRSQRDLSGGAGLSDYDAPDSIPSRYYASIGVNPFNRGQLAPFQKMSARATVLFTPVQSFSALHFISGRLVWVLRENLRYSGTDELLTPAFTVNALTSPVAATATDGQALWYAYASGGGGYAVAGTNYVKNDWGGGSAAAATTWRMLDYAGRLFGGDANGGLREILDALTTPLIYAHPRAASFRWRGVVASQGNFFAYGHTLPDSGVIVGNNVTSELYRFSVDPATGALTKPVIIASLPEEILCMCFVNDIAFIGTNKGFRCGQVAASGAITYGPLVKYNALVNSNGVTSCAVDGRFVVFSWGTMSVNGVSAWGVGRADMSNFTRPLVPAYCAAECISGSDVLSNPPSGVTMVYGWPYWTTGSGISFTTDYTYPPGGADGAGRNPAPQAGQITYSLYGPDNARTLFDNAMLVTSAYTWGVSDPRTPTHVDVVVESIVGEVSIGVGDMPNGISPAGYVQTLAGTGGPAALPSSQRVSMRRTHVAVGFRSGTSAPQSAPVVGSISLYASMNPPRVEEIILPLALGPDVDTRVGGHRASSQRAIYAALKALEASGRLVTYAEGDQTAIVRVDGVQLRPAYFDDRHDWWAGAVTVRLVTADLLGSLASMSAASAPVAGNSGSERPPAPQAGI